MKDNATKYNVEVRYPDVPETLEGKIVDITEQSVTVRYRKRASPMHERRTIALKHVLAMTPNTGDGFVTYVKKEATIAKYKNVYLAVKGDMLILTFDDDTKLAVKTEYAHAVAEDGRGDSTGGKKKKKKKKE